MRNVTIEVAADLICLRPQVQHSLLRLRQHGAVDAREPLGRNLGPELCPQLPVGLRTKLHRRSLLGAQPHPVRDVVLGNDEVLALVVAPADNDVAVWVAGVEVVDRDPIEPGAEILLHLPHHVAGEAAQVREPVAVLRSDDKAELVAVLAPALREVLAVRRVGLGTVKPAALAVARRPVALQVADVGVGRPAAQLQPHDPRLDHDAAHPCVRSTLNGHPLEAVGCRLAPADPGASSLPGPRPPAAAPPLPAHLGELQRTAIGPGCGSHDLSHKGPRPWACAGAAIPGAAGPWSEVERVVVGHGRQIAPTIASFKLEQPHLALQR